MLVRGAQAACCPDVIFTPLARRRAPGSSRSLRSDLEYVPGSSDPGVRDTEMGRRSRPAERLLPASRRRMERKIALLHHFRHAASEGLVRSRKPSRVLHACAAANAARRMGSQRHSTCASWRCSDGDPVSPKRAVAGSCRCQLFVGRSRGKSARGGCRLMGSRLPPRISPDWALLGANFRCSWCDLEPRAWIGISCNGCRAPQCWQRLPRGASPKRPVRQARSL